MKLFGSVNLNKKVNMEILWLGYLCGLGFKLDHVRIGPMQPG